jgi:hypothetical protein
MSAKHEKQALIIKDDDLNLNASAFMQTGRLSLPAIPG